MEYQRYNAQRAPSIADTMSVFSGHSVHGSVYGAGAMALKEKPNVPLKINLKPPVPKAPLPR
jgi:hypothetical protein